MAEKISTVVLKVDLECERCYRKIRKVLCRLQDRENIKTISYDEKANTVTISGPFDPDRVCDKLDCEAGKVIKDMQVKGKGKEKDKDDKGKEKPSEKDAKAKADEKGAKPEKKVKFEVPEEGGGGGEKPKAAVARMEPEPPAPMVVAQGMAMPSIWAPPGVPQACCYEAAYYGGGRCSSCGRAGGWPGAYGYGYGVPAAYGYGGAARHAPYPQFSAEEDPNAACTLM